MADSEKLVEDLFEAALAQPPDERTAWLDSACPNSPEVRELVRMLLLADERAGDFLEAPLLSTSDTSPQPEPDPSFEPGDIIAGRFHIHRFIARGGMGEVYEAWDSELRERVAIKTIRPDLAERAQVIDRFRREVKQARAISHPNICRIHELFCDVSHPAAKVWFLSMEFLDGFTLSEHLRHLGPIKPALAFDLLQQIVSGLKALHANGVIHRDLKTGNIMLVTGTLGHLRAVITDFGLATNVLRPEAGLTERGGQGTPEYMAPEQRTSADVTALADQYALGVILSEMLTGSRPTRNEVTSGRPQFEAKLAKTTDPRWARVILRCLEQAPERRFKTLDEIVNALKPAHPRTRLWLATAAAIALAIAATLWFRSRPAAAPSTSLAVLPLRNETGNPDLDYVADGISEALTDDLSQMPGLQVTPGIIARRYGHALEPETLGVKLHVGSVLSGSLGTSGGVLRIPVELVDTVTGKQKWGKTYQGTISDLAEIQHEISTDAAYSLKIGLDKGARARLQRQYATNAPAYDAYLKGRFNLSKRSLDALQEAILDFQTSLQRDPRYAPALAGLADCYSLLGYYGMQDPVPSFRKALASSQQALELDSTLGDAYASRAIARTFLDFDWRGAEEDYQKALALNPSNLTAHNWYALLLLVPLGRQSEAAVQTTYMKAADPGSLVTVGSTATLNYFAGHFDSTIASIEPRLPELQHFEPIVHVLSLAYLAKGENDKAIQLLTPQPGSSKELVADRAAPLGIAFARTGQMKKALAQLRIVEENSSAGGFYSYEAASLYLAVNDRQRAMDMLERAYKQRESSIIFLNVDPMLAPLRTEPRFRKLVGQMHLE